MSTRSHIQLALDHAESNGNIRTADLLREALRETARSESGSKSSSTQNYTTKHSGVNDIDMDDERGIDADWDAPSASSRVGSGYDSSHHSYNDDDHQGSYGSTYDRHERYSPPPSDYPSYRPNKSHSSRSRSRSGGGSDAFGSFAGGLLGSMTGSFLGNAFSGPITTSPVISAAPTTSVTYYGCQTQPVVIGTRRTFYPGVTLF
ncbi:hypothetical protein IAT40_001425 [Kwoniella sp. CBS 6097]